MWQKAAKSYIDSGELVAIGVVQEQHPDRTRLYRQWRELEWPIMVDTLNTLDFIQVVPVPVGIDESGVVAYPRFSPNQLEEFMASESKGVDVAEDYNRAGEPDFDRLRAAATSVNTSENWTRLGAAHFHRSGGSELQEAIDAFERAVELDPSDGQAHFSLGAALRRRYETSARRPGDAQSAVEHWGRALAVNPNHYIWRRRIQQYGPRLDKPYNFYFWVEQARVDIRARGAEPIALAAEPMGSELAPPQRQASTTVEPAPPNPDPEGKIHRDAKSLVGVEAMVTPARVMPGKRIRARVTFRLNEDSHPLWNNEADDLMLWVDLPEGLGIHDAKLSFPNPKEPETRELRTLEFEVSIAEDFAEKTVQAHAYALYYVCEDEGGVCYYLRQDFELGFAVDSSAPKIGQGR